MTVLCRSWISLLLLLILRFRTVTQRRLIIIYRRFGKPIGHIFMGTLKYLRFPGILLGPWPLKTEPVGCPETSAAKYQSVLRNIPEEGRHNLNRDGSLKSRSTITIIIIFVILRIFVSCLYFYVYALVYLCWLYTAVKPTQT